MALLHDRRMKLGVLQPGPTPEYTFIINFLQGFGSGTNEKGMHLLLDR